MIQSSMTTPKNSPTLRLLEIITLLLLLLSLLYLAFSYPQLPAQIPSHFDASGEVTAHDSKSSLWILGFSMLLLYVIMSLLYALPLSSRWVNLPQHIKEDTTGKGKILAYEMMAWLKLFSILVIALLILLIIQQAQGNPASTLLFVSVMVITLLAPLVILGIYMNKMAKLKPQE